MSKTIMTIILLLAVTVVSSGSQASTLQQLEKQLEQLQQQREDAEAALKSLANDSKQINKELANLDLRMYDLNTEIYDLEERLEIKQQEIAVTDEEMEEILQRQAQQFADTKERIKVMYEYGDTGYLEVLLSSSDLSDFFNRMEYIDKVVAFDKGVMDKMLATQQEIAAKRSQLEIQQNELDAMKIEAEEDMDSMETLVQNKQRAKEQIESDRTEYLEKMKWLEEQEAKVDKAIKDEIAKSQLKYAGGKFSWPVPGWYNLSSVFGPRYHPIFKTMRNHDGIDIPASYGTEIHAAASGKVIISGWSNAYGNYIVIDHGSGYATLYAHCSKLLVSKGSSVSRGDLIAKVGSTGWSTGNHLHFGIQKDGTWINPEPLLKAQ